ncbi:hypothetical protein [Bradyrhizobium nitroreducens]|nr:hypothetical protein [Bradyrhizobium nitroreducens]
MGVGEDFATFRDNYQITQEKIGRGEWSFVLSPTVDDLGMLPYRRHS